MNEKTTSAAELIATLESIAVGDSCFHILASKSPATCAASVKRNRAAIATVQGIIEERDALRADAERYRWLRDISVPPHNFYLSVPVEFYDVIYKASEVDKCIDEAIAALRATNPAQDKTKTDEIKIPEGFTAWPGGECPVDDGAKVDIVLRNGWRNPNDIVRVDGRYWDFYDQISTNCGIIAYRVVTT